ncbi:thioredoxin family protein [Chytridium lagenaria]|nr:thioredoxin family protein [Chytridium lagenaria]
MLGFINRDDVDFDSIDSITPEQDWDLVQHPGRHEIPEYPTKIAKFSNVRNLTLFFPTNYGGDVSRISYVGLKGEWTEVKRDPIITLYEIAPNPADHQKIKGASENNMASESFH